MKDYLALFRGQAFQASFTLYKRILPGASVATLIIGIILLIVITPLTLMTMGYGATDIMGYQQDLMNFQKTIVESQQDFETISEAYTAQFSHIQLALVFPMLIVVLLIYSWVCLFYLNLNNNEIRFGSSKVFSALKASFSNKIIKIAGFFILYFLIMVATLIIFSFILILLQNVSSILAVLVGFVGFFVFLAFLLRFTISIPAIVHGEMGMVPAIAFSLSRITWKRGAILLLMGLVSMMALGLIAAILGGIVSSSQATEFSIGNFIGQQIISLIINILFTTYIFAAMSTLYFRYSDDSTEDETVHLVDDYK